MVGVVVQRPIEHLLPFQSQLGKRVDGISDIAGSDRRLGDFHQPDMGQAAVAAPVCIHIMGIGIVNGRKAVFEYIDISTGQADGNLAGTIRTGGIQHHVAAVCFAFVLLPGRDAVLFGFLCIKYGRKGTSG